MIRTLLYRFILLISTLCLINGCTQVQLPDPDLPEISRDDLGDSRLLRLLQADWTLLESSSLSPSKRQVVMDRYNQNLLLLLRRARHDYQEYRKKYDMEQDGAHSKHLHCYMPSEFFVLLEPGNGEVDDLSETFKDFVAACDVPLDVLSERHVIPGLGVALVAVVPDDVAKKDAQYMTVEKRCAVRCLTAVMTFPKDALRPVLKLVSTLKQEELKVGKYQYNLAQDLSAPIEAYWMLTGAKEWSFKGFTDPSSMRKLSCVFCMDTYDPERIPVILTHGLASSPDAFSDMVNSLKLNPAIRRNYQFWYYGYATAVAWPATAMYFRLSLNKVKEAATKSAGAQTEIALKNWNRKVLVGHSMGGLITRYNQCVEPWHLLDDIATEKMKRECMHERYIDYIYPEAEKHLQYVHNAYFFRPVSAGCVVYMATPHQGSWLAAYKLTNIVRVTMSKPADWAKMNEETLAKHAELFTLSIPDLAILNTSIDQLKPRSITISGLQRLKVQDVPTYSIIGDNGSWWAHLTNRKSDGIVPYWSSHIGWGKEFIVPSGHSVQAVPETAKHMETILLEHLQRCGIKTD